MEAEPLLSPDALDLRKRARGGPAPARTSLTDAERTTLLALATAAFPASDRLPGGSDRTVAAFEDWLGHAPAVHQRILRGLLATVEASTIPTRLRPFSRLSERDRASVLEGMERSSLYLVRALHRAVTAPLKRAHFDHESVYRALGVPWPEPVRRDEPARWLTQVHDGDELSEDLDVACEVVVVGTGAGGAAAAYELARRGRAVVLLEEGALHRRSSFQGTRGGLYQRLYRDYALTIGLGNAGVPVWAGRAVGGSTVINSGTCYRTTERVFARWRAEHGLPSEFSATGLGPYFERVEQMLGVAPGEAPYLGAIAGIIARGSERLGLRHAPLHRNAPGCDGQGQCCFGCPTGAKRSTDVSYVPAALSLGAELYTNARVANVEVVAGRARGVVAHVGRPRADGSRAKLRVRAEAVVVAGGALMTPLLLERSGVCKGPLLGKNLSIHPASKVIARMDERVEQWRGIPQSYAIETYAHEGLMFEGGSLPPDIASVGFPWTGERLMRMMESYAHLATFGFMIEDTSRGQVRAGPDGSPVVLYRMNAHDAARMQRGFAILTEVFLEAGAREVFPLIHGHEVVTSKADLERLRAARVRPGEFDVAGFHPLGTCRIGGDEANSCLTPDHEARDARGLFVCDGSALPSSLGVNPQLTIMATALRAAEGIDARLSSQAS